MFKQLDGCVGKSKYFFCSSVVVFMMIFSASQMALSQEKSSPQEEFKQCQQQPLQKSIEEILENNPSTTLAPYVAIHSFYESNPRLCSKLKNDDDITTCFDAYYMLTNQCDNIQKNFKKWICYSMNSNDSSICSNEVTIWKSACEAIYANDQTFCNSEKNPTGCLNAFNLKQALISKNMEFCDRIKSAEDEVPYLTCLIMLAPKSDKTLAEINLSYKTNVCNEMYSSQLATIQQDPSLCMKIPHKQGRNKRLFSSCLAQFTAENVKK